MDRFRPEHFMLLPTMSCQASCRYCFAEKAGGIMPRETAERSLDLIARLAPEKQDFNLTFHGGEPLLAGEDFYAWILPELIHRFGRRVHLCVQSNLWALTENIASLFSRYRVSVGASLDGPEDMCAGQRGKGYYERTMAGIKLLRYHGIETGIICTFTADHAHRAEEVYRESRIPYAIHGAVPMIGNTHGPFCVDAEQMTKIYLDSYNAYRSDPAHCRITTLDAMAKGCLDRHAVSCIFSDCLGAFAAIGPDGGIYPCQRFCGIGAFRLGNVNEDPTETDILNSPVYLRLRKMREAMRSACVDCSHNEYCAGGCLYNAIAAETVKDPYCSAYKAVFDRISIDMAKEMGSVMLGSDKPAPVLAMAGDQEHPYDLRRNRELLALALEKGRSDEPFAAGHLRDPYPENALNKLYLHLTFDCPLHCSHCYAEGGHRKTKELSPERFAEIIREAADRCFASAVITGGEPLVYPGFDEFCSLLSETDRKGMKLILRTSFGFPIPTARLRMIFDLFDEVMVSVDGDRVTHDLRRGSGQYDRTLANLEAAVLLGASAKLGIAAVLSRREAEGPAGESIRDLADRLGIRKVSFRPLLPLGRAAGTAPDPWQFCSDETIRTDRFQIRHSCGLGQNLYIEPDGTAYPCYAWSGPEKKLGDLSRESLGTLLDRGGLYDYCRHDVDTNKKCRSCEVRYLCGGICKALVRERTDPDSGDFDCDTRKAYFLRMAEIQIAKEV